MTLILVLMFGLAAAAPGAARSCRTSGHEATHGAGHAGHRSGEPHHDSGSDPAGAPCECIGHPCVRTVAVLPDAMAIGELRPVYVLQTVPSPCTLLPCPAPVHLLPFALPPPVASL